MLALDHIAVSGQTLAEARAHVEASLGVDMQNGRQHAVFHTHNALMGLEERLYLEAIAINPDAPTPERPRWFDLDRFSGAPRLTNWILRTDDIEATLARLPDSVGNPVALQRGDLRWRMAVPGSGVLPFDNIFPAIIQWDVPVTPPDVLGNTGLFLRRLSVQHPEAAALSELLGLEDDRVVFRSGAPALSASFETPSGVRRL